ncbi:MULTISPECIES: hypothetical protein [unclassified Janthinobacterium]|uniref:hypothetical protein n=1 Tax=unclassified Janthinobacterium TaxID=2610881 RepID=UPI001586F3C7|nr:MULTISPECIES: hypothetical protein [unclassified Janthinobacterium]
MTYKSSTEDGFDQFTRALYDESDRGLALIAASALDFDLGQLLRKTVVDNKKIAKEIFETSRPLSSFSSRIDVAYLLGILSIEEHHELHLIRKIRNEFGHSFDDTSFSTKKIKSMCEHLKLSIYPDAPERNKFQMSTAFLLGSLKKSIEQAQHVAEAQATDFSAANESWDTYIARLKKASQRTTTAPVTK